MDAFYFMFGFSVLTGLGLFAVLLGRALFRLVRAEFILHQTRLANAKQTKLDSSDSNTDSSESDTQTEIIVESEKIVVFPGSRDWSKYERPTCLDEERMASFQSRKVDRELRREFDRLADVEEA